LGKCYTSNAWGAPWSIPAIFFSKASEERKHKQNLQTQAYVDFLRAVAGLAIARRFGDRSEKLENVTLLADAKARISIYGTKPVVESLAEFLRGDETLNSLGSKKAFVKVCQTIRSESLTADQAVLDRDVSQLLLGHDISRRIRKSK